MIIQAQYVLTFGYTWQLCIVGLNERQKSPVVCGPYQVSYEFKNPSTGIPVAMNTLSRIEDAFLLKW